MSNTQVLAFIFTIFFITGCSTAQRSSEVASTRAPVAPYLKMDCRELATEQTRLVRDARAAGAEVDSKYDSDKTAEVVTWILFAPAAFFIEGNQAEASRLAAIKGQLEAVQEAQSVNKCIN